MSDGTDRPPRAAEASLLMTKHFDAAILRGDAVVGILQSFIDPPSNHAHKSTLLGSVQGIPSGSIKSKDGEAMLHSRLSILSEHQ